MTNRKSVPQETETNKKSDRARGQRDLPKPSGQYSDLAAGERQPAEATNELTHPDFAEGQRDLPKPSGQHPDFARGQDARDRTQAGGHPINEPQKADKASDDDDTGVMVMEVEVVEVDDPDEDDPDEDDDLDEEELDDDEPDGDEDDEV